MFKTKKTRVIGLALIAALILVGAIYAGAAWAAPGPSSAGTTAQTTAADQTRLRAAILDMLRDHMGVTGTEAENLADQMLSRMQNAGTTANFGTMIERCEQFMDGNGTGTGRAAGGTGMMGGAGRGMMGGAGRGMMGSGMMGSGSTSW